MAIAVSPALGQLSTEEFLADYWQQQPLLIRNALPDFNSPLAADELAGLSLEAEVESRLVTGRFGHQPWKLCHGPFNKATFSSLAKENWTLLVQAVDLWVPEVKILLNYFDFLPSWRVDDIMVSYAVKGGSVGPHFDHYDVFLIQGAGQRRWQTGELCDSHSPLLTDADLKILQHFVPQQEWDVNPGDILYLPPCIAHHGVSLDNECITYSVGFRSPTAAEMLSDLATELMSQQHQLHYTDPPLTPDMAKGQLPDAFVQQVKQLLLDTLDDEELLSDWFARYMTAPKYFDLDSQPEGGHSENGRFLKTKFGDYLNGERLNSE